MIKKPLVIMLLIVLVLSISPQPDTSPGLVHAAPAPKSETVHKVIAPPGLLGSEMQGVTLLEDYGSFVLYRVSDQALAGLEPEIKAQVRVVDEMDRLLLPPQAFHTQQEPPKIAPQMQIAPEKSSPGLHVVQFVGPIRSQWLDELRASGAIPVHYVANNGYLVWTDRAGQTRLETMAREKVFLQYSTPYHPYYKLGASIRDLTLQPDGSEVTVDVQVYAAAKGGTSDLLKYATAQLSPWTPILDYQNVRIKVRAADLLALSQRPEVVWIGKHVDPELQDEIQAQIMAGNWTDLQIAPGTPSYLDWLDSYGFSTDPADYPIVDIVDDGVGNGQTACGDPTLHELGDALNPTRLAYVTSCTFDGDGGGVEGHGHINTSIAGGYDARVGSPYQDDHGYWRGLGINPYGRLASTKVFGPYFDLSLCGDTEVGLIQHIQDSGAQIASNSWGCGPDYCSDYDLTSQAFDAGVRDADASEPGNQELVLLVAAGNYGPGLSSVGSPGNAKNVITVGASENVRPEWTDNCGAGPTEADQIMDIAYFSSRGPVPGGRVKPEVVAPGTHIQGTASPHADYNGAGVCDAYWPDDQTTFASSTGTSHSTPAVAGTASLYYYWLANQYAFAPSPALIKASMIVHTTYMTGTDANDTLPSNHQGYGIPNMGMAFDDTPRYMVNQSVTLDDSGETWDWQGSVADPTKPVRIVLAYTDKPGFAGSSPQVNNLDLEVKMGTVQYWGNVFAGQWSAAGGLPDSQNNYEAVYLPAGHEGAFSISVTGFNIADDGVPGVGDSTDQDFALVCYNCLEVADFSLNIIPRKQSVCAPDAALYEVEVRRSLDFAIPVQLSVPDLPAGAVPVFGSNPVIPPASSQLTIEGTDAFTPGLHALSVLGTNTVSPGPPTGTHSIAMQLEVWTEVPGAVNPTHPPNGVTVPGRDIEIEWGPASQAIDYHLELAADPDFANLVYTATTTSHSYPISDTLAYDTTYYWRITARNTCGQGQTSSTFQFATGPAPLVFCRSPMLDIPDALVPGVTDTISIDADGTLFDLNVALTTTHTWVGDLVFTLKHEDTGTEVVLIDRPGREQSGSYGCSGDDIRVILDDEGDYSIQNDCDASGQAYIDGEAYRPAQPLSTLDGQELDGVWTLSVSDHAYGDTGWLEAWCLVATISSTTPVLVEPAEMLSVQPPGEQVTQTLTLTNTGDLALQWQLEGVPSWLEVSADQGSLDIGASTVVQVMFDAAGYTPGVYTGTLRLLEATEQTMMALIPITMAVNNQPGAAADNYSTEEDTVLVVSYPGLLGNDGDPDSEPLTAMMCETPAAGTLQLEADGSFVYTPALDADGVFTFTYQACDHWSMSDPAMVTIWITSVNDPPTVIEIPNQDVQVDTALPPIPIHVDDVDSPVCDVTLTVTSSNPLLVPADGLLLNGSCAERNLTITPVPETWGSTTITITANDGSSTSSRSFVLLVHAEHELYFPLILQGPPQLENEAVGPAP